VITRRPVRASAAAVLLACAGCGSEADPRSLHEPSGGFSYEPPPGWEVAQLPGMKYRVAHGEAEDFTDEFVDSAAGMRLHEDAR
jgi:hypothetical protein